MGTFIRITLRSDRPDVTALSQVCSRLNDGTLSRRGAARERGRVNYPTEWWHWSCGGTGLMTQQPAAVYGPKR
jgi:D-alanyl-D-alanine dipeptidase